MAWKSISLGYGVRIGGELLKSYQSLGNLALHEECLSTSYDETIVPSYLASEKPDFEFQKVIPTDFWGNGQHFLEAFGSFATDKDALSCLGGPAPKDVSLYMYEAFLPDEYEHEPGKSYFKAIQDGTYKLPTLNFSEVGHELFDMNFTSVTHGYRDREILKNIKWTPEHIEEIERRYDLTGLFVIKVFKASHPWWFK